MQKIKILLFISICVMCFGSSKAQAQDYNNYHSLKLEIPKINEGQEITLEQAIKIADKRNLTLLAAKTEIRKAKAEFKGIWGNLLPNAQGNMNFVHFDHENTMNAMGSTIVTTKQDDLDTGISVSLPIVNAQLWASVMVGSQSVDVAKLSVETARQALLLTVSEMYLNSLSAKAMIEVQQNQVSSLEQHLKIAQYRHLNGTTNRLDVVRAETELLAAKENLIKAIYLYNNTRDILKNLLAKDRNVTPVAVADFGEVPKKIKPITEGGLIDRRPDILLGKSKVSLYKKSLTSTYMQFIPTVGGMFNFNYQITDPPTNSPDRTRWYVGLSLSVPIFDYTIYSDIQSNRASYNKAKIELEDKERTARFNVVKAERAFNEAYTLLESSKRKASLGKEAMILAETAYRSGAGRYLDLIDAQRTAATAEIDYNAKQYNCWLSWIALQYEKGEDLGGLKY